MPRLSVSQTLRSWSEIDLDALRNNLALVRKMIGSRPGIVGVVKANAYGHGTAPIVHALAHDIAIFGVANLSEAREVSAVGTERDVMILSPCLPAERQAAVKEGYIVTVSSSEEAFEFSSCGDARVNFKVDTGMGRVGVWWEQAEHELKKMAGKVLVHSISTHLPCADEDLDFTRRQLGLFERMAATLQKVAPGAKIHSLNSSGISRFSNCSADLVRAGLILYGSSSLPDIACHPVLAWKTRVTLVRDLPAGVGISYGRTLVAPRPMRTAVLAVGYADGFPRQLSGQGTAVLIGGKKCPLLGRVTMDQIVVDVSEASSAKPGDEAVLIGRQSSESITVEELAAQADTISWHLFTGISSRVARVYF